MSDRSTVRTAGGADAPRPVVLVVRDGWGRNPHPEHDDFNAIHLASTPRCDALLRDYPWTLIKTSGEDVGLPGEPAGQLSLRPLKSARKQAKRPPRGKAGTGKPRPAKRKPARSKTR